MGMQITFLLRMCATLAQVPCMINFHEKFTESVLQVQEAVYSLAKQTCFAIVLPCKQESPRPTKG